LEAKGRPEDCCPVLSPDGRTVAFVRSQKVGYTLYSVSALGGTPKVLYSNPIDFPEHIGFPLLFRGPRTTVS